MHRLAPILLAPLLIAASAPVAPETEPLDLTLQRARIEQASAEAEAGRLEQAASRARDQAGRLRAQEAAAAQAIEAAEARITAADAQMQMVTAFVTARHERLRQEQQPVSSLLAGLAMMARRPPLLAIADQGSTDEFVRVRLLLDSTLPVIRRRTAALSAELNEGRKLEQTARAAREELVRSRGELALKRRQFAALEQQALRSAQLTGGQALGVGDIALAAGETAEQLDSEAASRRSAASLAAELATTPPAPARPMPPQALLPVAPLAYRLPAAAPVTDGLGAVNASGVRSRGLTLATSRGAAVTVPASGVIRFSGPFRDYDGIVIIDHGAGWMSLLVNVGSPLKQGTKVRIGDPLGRAIGPLGVELSRNGQRVSPALIAGSSESLSKAREGG